MFLKCNHDLKIFISYSRDEAGVLVAKLSQSLTDKGHDITNSVTDCDVFLLIMAQSSIIDSELQNDYYLASAENKKIVPYIYDWERHAGRESGSDKIKKSGFTEIDDTTDKILSLLNSHDNGFNSEKLHNSISRFSKNKIIQSAKLKNISITLVIVFACSFFFIYPFILQPSVNNTKEYFNSGTNFVATGQYRESITEFNKAIELDPGYVSAYYSKGTAFESLGDYTGAIENYNKAIELDPGYVSAYYSKGTAFESLGDYTGAIENYNKAIELDPGYAVSY
jgi:tetratricopeptide (TPR) repeat protein